MKISHSTSNKKNCKEGRACCINCKGIYLANIVQQHRPAQNRLRRNGGHGIGDMSI